MFLKLLLTHPVQTKLPYIVYIYITIFTILRAFPLYKAYMLGFGQVRKQHLELRSLLFAISVWVL